MSLDDQLGKIQAELDNLSRQIEFLSSLSLGVLTVLQEPLTSANWLGNAYSTASATEVDLTTEFGVPSFVRAVLCQKTIRDSATLGTTGLHFHLGPSATYYYMSDTHCPGGDVLNGGVYLVVCSLDGDNHPTVYYHIAASGSGTMDIWWRIWGYLK